MCGIAGYFDYRGQFINASGSLITTMSHTIRHRGPDNQGKWLSEDKRLVMGHQRLSILDLSKEGNQPMISSSGRYVIVFNGEIYNFKAMKSLLKDRQWRGSSDTEVLLEAIEDWGFESTLSLIEGMFAIALWDKDKKQLSLTRDRIGEKPLFYGWQNNTLLFASELKAMKSHPAFKAEIDTESAGLYFKYGYIPGQKSIYRDIQKVLPGEIIKFNLSSEDYITPINSSYWELGSALDRPSYVGTKNSLSSYTDELEAILIDVVEQESISDVPLGSFLSGGIDSSLITSILQKVSSSRIDTFSIGYKEKEYDEAPYARSVASHLKTNHNELILDSNDLKNTIPKLSTLFDEPFGDPSAVPTFLVSEFAKSKVTVCLSGDGGDELFGGYSRYQRAQNIWSRINLIPEYAKRLVNLSTRSLVNSRYETEFSRKSQRISLYMGCNSLSDCYELQSQTENSELNKFLKIEPTKIDIDIPKNLSEFERMLYVDLKTYLPDDILVKVDRSAMAVSLETRAPFLHHNIVEFAFNLPLQYKYKGNLGKIILRNLLERHVPLSLFNRPKMGFGIPIDNWIRADLKEWAGDLLSIQQLEKSGIFKPELIRSRFQEHLDGKRDWHYFLWHVLMFIEWQNLNKVSSSH